MQEVELFYDGPTAVEYSDPAGLLPTSGAVNLINAAGQVVCSGSVTLPTAATQVAEGAISGTQVPVDDITGFGPGQMVRVNVNGQLLLGRVARVETGLLHLQEPLSVVPPVGADVQAITMAASIPAPGAAAIGPFCRLAWTYSDGDTDKRASVSASVVRWPWEPPVTVAQVRAKLAQTHSVTRRPEWLESIANDANSDIRAKIASSGRRAALFLGSADFSDVARKAVVYHLAVNGVCIGDNVIEAQREARFALDDAMTALLQGAAYDSDGDGAITGTEAVIGIRVARMVR